MKKIIYIISLFVSSVLYTSCDALDLAPEDYFGSGNYWNNEAHKRRIHVRNALSIERKL